MIHYIKIDLTKEIDITKSKYSKGYMVYYYLYFNHMFAIEELFETVIESSSEWDLNSRPGNSS